MKKLPSAEVRAAYLRFFEQRGHAIVPSASLIPGNDPTLLFTNSGMVQFKDTFLGLEQRLYTRATTAQKCLRVSGKHNDLEEVGPSPRHQTFFEMLGNFSFGDYFKAEAIQMAWDLLTKEFNLPVERLWFTVFGGENDVAADDEAARLWEQVGVNPSRIVRFGSKDNFWEMGATGPCGPSSEITFYLGDDVENQRAEGVNSDDPLYMEFWNLVFTQYNRNADGTLSPLPKPSVDTGMGFERMVSVLQGARNNYDTDIFRPIIERTITLLGSDEQHYRDHVALYRAVADHSRAVAFLIADGVLPGNNGRSYVLRRVLRRAAYQGRTIGFERPFMADVVDRVIAEMGAAYPELQQRRAFILETTDAEEQQFLRTLSGGMVRLNAVVEQVKNAGGSMLAGADAFTLKDTYGFPLDLTQKIAADHALTVDEAGYDAAMNAQRARGREAAQFKRGADAEVWAEQELPATTFTGYEATGGQGRVLAVMMGGDMLSRAEQGQRVQVLLDHTPFYAESGGQVGDAGQLVGPAGRIRINDTQRPVSGLIVHYGEIEQGSVSVGETVDAEVEALRRHDIARNHTATHLLHRALRDALGEHAAQAGSLVAPDRLRFDFNNTRALAPEQVRAIEQHVNTWVRADTPVSWAVLPRQEALDQGAMALFGEKYGDEVRMVTAGCGDMPDATRADSMPTSSFCSRELCGGTHVERTGEIGYFRIIAESGVAAGTRRIEALTGYAAEVWAEAQHATLRDVATRLNVPPTQVLERVDGLLAELRQQRQELDGMLGQQARDAMDGLLDQVQRQNGLAYLAARVDAPDATRLREMGDWLRDKLGSGLVVLGAVLNDKPQLLVVITPDLVKQGYHAGNLVKALAALVGGGGGGRPDMAQAGGRDAGKLDAALAQVPQLVDAQAKK